MALNAQKRRFVEEYLVDLNATAAYIRAGYSPRGAPQNSSALMADAEVAAAVAEAQAARSARTEITQDMVLQRWWGIATADPNELVQYRRVCCRHCWGRDHEFQWTAREFAAAQRKHEHQKQLAIARKREFNDPEPDPMGGLDFDRTKEPHPDCPECRGEGVGDTHVLDTRHLTGPARLLYAGVKEGKDGLEVKLQDQSAALERVARHLGMFKDKGDNPVSFNFTISPDDAKL